MVTPERMLDALALAGVPAVLCRRTSAGAHAVTRTPEFLRVMYGVTDHFDEPTLLWRVGSAWPVCAEPVLISLASRWKCVLQPAGDVDACIAMLRVPESFDEHHDTFFSIVENLPDVVTRHDREYRFVYVNPAIETSTGKSPEFRVGKTHTEAGAPRELADVFEDVYEQVFATGKRVVREFSYSGALGARHYVGEAVPEFDHDGQVATVLSIVRDITEIKRLQRQLEHLAHTDPLTGLANRRSLLDFLDGRLQRVRSGAATLTVLLLDVDAFKEINDGLGHVVGDRVLAGIADVLLDETGPHDVAARLGGDEFCVALVDADPPAVRTVEARLRRRIGAIDFGDAGSDSRLSVVVSVGVAHAEATDDVATLLARVDALMYEAKRRAR